MAARKDSDKIALVSKSGGGSATNRMYVLTQEQKEEIGRMAGYLTITQIAHKFGINIDTFNDIRKRDAEVCLIFITSLAQYALKGYEVNAFDFLVKPLSYELFCIKFEI